MTTITEHVNPLSAIAGGTPPGTEGQYIEDKKGDCGLIIPAIGYYSEPIEGVPFDARRGVVVNADGRVEPGLYAVGWIKRGPSGVIGTNKPDGDLAAEQIAEDVGAGGKAGRQALERLLSERKLRAVGFADWKRIEAAEIANARPGAPRRKFFRVADMLAVLEGGQRSVGALG